MPCLFARFVGRLSDPFAFRPCAPFAGGTTVATWARLAEALASFTTPTILARSGLAVDAKRDLLDRRQSGAGKRAQRVANCDDGIGRAQLVPI